MRSTRWARITALLAAVVSIAAHQTGFVTAATTRSRSHKHEEVEAAMRSRRMRSRVLTVALATIMLVCSSALPALAKTPSVKTLAKQVAALQKQNASLRARLNALAATPGVKLSQYVTIDPGPENGVAGPNVVFHGCNVHVVSGSGAEDDHGDLTGLGNLIVGYDDAPPSPPQGYRAGSHNLVVGDGHTFESCGGFAAGLNNVLGPSATFASVTGGSLNSATGELAGVSGGANNQATGELASVSGGQSNTASGYASSVSGGEGNVASALEGWAGGSSGTAYAGQFHSP